jgi:hypothetical protein
MREWDAKRFALWYDAPAMFRDPAVLVRDLDALEGIERASLRMVTQALVDFRQEATKIYAEESDLQADIGEDITREALDNMGVSRIPLRLFGKIDYKRARYVFHPDYAVRQALLVDSKAEKEFAVARLQTSQTSMIIKQIRAGKAVEVPGDLPKVIEAGGSSYLTTTILVKFWYEESRKGKNELKLIRVAALPNGMLQARYNPTPQDSIWTGGPNAPSRGEVFRTRLSFERLKAKASWRVQDIPVNPKATFVWAD